MLASVVAFGVLTFTVPGLSSDSDSLSAGNTYSAEEVILNQNDVPDDQVTDGQVLSNLYVGDEEK